MLNMVRMPNVDRLAEQLDIATSVDPAIDELIAETFEIPVIGFTSSAMTARDLVARILPEASLRVGFDVCGFLPSATIRNGSGDCTAVAPSVPIAILRAMMRAMQADDRTD